MSFWFTPVGIILPPIIFILPAIIHRFLVSKKTLKNKKAAVISIIYTIACFTILAIISNEEAFFQGFSFIPLGFVNHFILAGVKENEKGQIFIFRTLWSFACIITARIIASIVFSTVYSDPSDLSTASISCFILITPVIGFHIYKYKKVKENVEAKFRWREKLKEEASERERQEQDIE